MLLSLGFILLLMFSPISADYNHIKAAVYSNFLRDLRSSDKAKPPDHYIPMVMINSFTYVKKANILKALLAYKKNKQGPR